MKAILVSVFSHKEACKIPTAKEAPTFHHPTMCLFNLDAEEADVGVESNGKDNAICN